MKVVKLICSVLFIFTLNAKSQTSEAIFVECENNEEPEKCTSEKFNRDIAALITPQISADLKKSLANDHFSISIIMISDKEGKIISAETRLICPQPLEKPIKEYISKLPALIPVNKIMGERRSLHIINSTFLIDDSGFFILATKDELKALKITPEILPLDTYPVYPGCEGFENDSKMKCLNTYILKFILKNYRIPENDYYGKIKMMVSFIIEKDGAITLDKIIGGEEPFRNEIKRVINTLPKAKPGNISNIPVRVSCMLPVTINMQ
jgi:hypothetical protein